MKKITLEEILKAKLRDDIQQKDVYSDTFQLSITQYYLGLEDLHRLLPPSLKRLEKDCLKIANV